MKTQLTKEQSQHLIDLGAPKEMASDKISYGFLGYDPIFSLTDLLEILPKRITSKDDETITFKLDMECQTGSCGANDTLWIASYITDRLCENWVGEAELIDSLYELCVFCLENKYLKFE